MFVCTASQSDAALVFANCWLNRNFLITAIPYLWQQKATIQFRREKKGGNIKAILEVWSFLAVAHSGNSAHPSERLSVFAQYSWRLVLSQTLCSEARERQKAVGRPAFPHSCPPPSWHSAPPSQYENKFSSLFAINFPLRWREKNQSWQHNI